MSINEDSSITSDASTSSLVALLDAAEMLPAAKALRERSYDLLRLAPGAVVVDVGCGTGRAVAELARLGAASCGVDASVEMVEAARGRWPGADLRVADAYELPFRDGQVGAYRADKVYHQLADPAAVVSEARRVLAPGGRIVVVGQDWDLLAIDSDDAALTRRIVHARADTLPSPRVARSTRNLLLDAGFQDVAVEVHVGVFTDGFMVAVLDGMVAAARDAGAVTAAQAAGWGAEQRRRAERDRLLVVMPMFLVSATAGPVRVRGAAGRSGGVGR